jgi:hypothetical protein
MVSWNNIHILVTHHGRPSRTERSLYESRYNDSLDILCTVNGVNVLRSDEMSQLTVR